MLGQKYAFVRECNLLSRKYEKSGDESLLTFLEK